MTTKHPIPVLSAHPYPAEVTQPVRLLSPALQRRLGLAALMLAFVVLVVGLISLLAAPGIHWPALWLVLPGAGLVGVARWVLGEAGREEWGL